jgi:hypothetical protein
MPMLPRLRVSSACRHQIELAILHAPELAFHDSEFGGLRSSSAASIASSAAGDAFQARWPAGRFPTKEKNSGTTSLNIRSYK